MVDAAKRIPQLVDAVLSVTSSLALPEVLREIVEAAQSLVGARYAALGVLGDDPWLSAFIHTGMDEEHVSRMRDLPEGKGVLGRLISDPRPLRLRTLGDHPSAEGFPAGHPHMTSFLGAPITVDGQAFGNLYLTDKEEDEEFSEADEELVVALATVAGAAIHNARLYDTLQQRQRWLDAALGVTAALLDHQGLDEILERIAVHARDLVTADIATIALPVGEDLLQIRVAVGLHATGLQGATFSRRGSISGDLLLGGDVIVMQDVAADPRTAQPLVKVAAFGPGMFVPLQARGARFGTLVVANLRDRRGFTDDDCALVVSLAGQASMALDYHRAQDTLQRLLVVEERERIGRDLRESVISRLSATGWALEQAATTISEADPEVSRDLMAHVDDLDASIRDIRTMVFGKAGKPPPSDPSVPPGRTDGEALAR